MVSLFEHCTDSETARFVVAVEYGEQRWESNWGLGQLMMEILKLKGCLSSSRLLENRDRKV